MLTFYALEAKLISMRKLHRMVTVEWSQQADTGFIVGYAAPFASGPSHSREFKVFMLCCTTSTTSKTADVR